MDNQEFGAAAEPRFGMAGIAKFMAATTGHRPSRGTIWRWHLSGRLAARRIGKRFYSTESEVRAMLQADEQGNRGSADQRGNQAAQRLKAIGERDAVNGGQA